MWNKKVIIFLYAIVSICHASEDILCSNEIKGDSSPGICISLTQQLRDCPPLYANLKTKNFLALRESFCDGVTDLTKAQVCCPINSYNERYPQEPPEPDYERHSHFHLVPSPENSSCGMGFLGSDRILGGKNAGVRVYTKSIKRSRRCRKSVRGKKGISVFSLDESKRDLRIPIGSHSHVLFTWVGLLLVERAGLVTSEGGPYGHIAPLLCSSLYSLPGEYPWMARIGLQRVGEDIIDFGCGGTIINKRYILTAAHCFKDKNYKLALIRLGETNELTEKDCITVAQIVVDCGETEDYDAEELIIHPGYTGRIGSKDDIALIRLDRDITNTSSYFTKPVCLPFSNEFGLQFLTDRFLQRKRGTITGWGKVKNNENLGSPILQTLEVPIRSNIACRVAFSANNITHPNQLCAGGEAGKDSCLGDSGGPITVSATNTNRKNKTPRHYQVGVVSFGRNKCATENVPVVYTRIRSYLKWILDSIRE